MQLDNANEKEADLTTALQQVIEQRCQCGFNEDLITEGGFQRCLLDDYVTFRANIYGVGAVSTFQLISFIKDWIKDEKTIVIQSLRLTLDSVCPVAIDSVSDPDCTASLGTSRSSDGGGSDNTVAIIGGVVVAVVVVVAIAVVVVVVVVAVLNFKSRQAEQKITCTE